MAASAIARKILGSGVKIRAALVQMGPMTIDRKYCDWDHVDKNPLFCPDPSAVKTWQQELIKRLMGGPVVLPSKTPVKIHLATPGTGHGGNFVRRL